MDNKMILLGGLWLNESKNGNKYMSGKLGLGGKLLVFKNTNKSSDNQPDYMLYIVSSEKPENDDLKDVEF